MDMVSSFLEGCRESFESGNKWSLMQAIMVSAQERRALPEWASKAYIAAFETCRTGAAKSWDDVFGKPYPLGAHHAAVTKRHRVQWHLFRSVKEMLKDNPGMAIDDGIFEAIGKEFGVGKTLAKKFYYDAKKKTENM